MNKVPITAIRKAIARLDHAQRCIRNYDAAKIHPRLRGESSDFIRGALYALEWVVNSAGDIDAGPAGKLSED